MLFCDFIFTVDSLTSLHIIIITGISFDVDDNIMWFYFLLLIPHKTT